MNHKPVAINKLTPSQKQAVSSRAHNIVVLAGAGSGKTHIITEKIVHFIDDNIVTSPSAILALTFSSKAAQEMKNRLVARLSTRASSVMVRTFHSAGLKVLRSFPKYAGLNPDFDIVDSKQQYAIARRVMQRQSIYTEESSVLDTVARIKNQIETLDFLDKHDRSIFEDYQAQLRANNLIDFNDMLWLSVQLLSGNENIRNQFRRRFEFILVDEYQDINAIQMEFVNLVRGEETGLCVVGDDDQCIYEWRGAEPGFIRQLAEDHSSEKVIMTENFRSSRAIIEVANVVIAQNLNRVTKSMHTENGKGPKPIVCSFGSEGEQARFLAEQISHLATRGYSFKDIAILVRTNEQTQPIEASLAKRGIPFGGELFFEQRSVRVFLSLLQGINAPNIGGNLAKAVNFPNRILDNLVFSELKEEYGLDSESDSENIEKLATVSPSWQGQKELRRRLEIIFRFAAQLEELEVDHLVKGLIEAYDLGKEYRDSPLSEEDARRRENIARLLELAEEFTRTSELKSLGGFLDHLHMLSLEASSAIHERNAVSLLTCHHAKGLEFPIVFVAGVQVGVFPNDYFVRSIDHLEQERRLFYVAITRAQKVLFISQWSDNSRKGKAEHPIIKTGFMEEIPEALVQSLF